MFQSWDSKANRETCRKRSTVGGVDENKSFWEKERKRRDHGGGVGTCRNLKNFTAGLSTQWRGRNKKRGGRGKGGGSREEGGTADRVEFRKISAEDIISGMQR